MVMNSAVSATPMMPASALAWIASLPSDGPTTRWSMTSTGTGSEPPSISAARSLASSSVKEPVIVLVPPPIPMLHRLLPPLGSTCGAVITSLSRTIATSRFGVLTGWQAALPVMSAQILPPSSLNFIWTNQPCAICWESIRPSAPLTFSPVMAGLARRSTPAPFSAGRYSSPAAGLAGFASTWSSTSWKVSWAVLPITFAASRGSCTPGSSTMIRFSPWRVTLGSLTPRASIRRRSTSSALSVVSLSAFTVGESFASSTIWVPPRRSRPSSGFAVSTTYVDAARTRNANSARTRDDRFTTASGRWAPTVQVS